MLRCSRPSICRLIVCARSASPRATRLHRVVACSCGLRMTRTPHFTIRAAPASLVAPCSPRHFRPRSKDLLIAQAALRCVPCRPCTAPRVAQQFDIQSLAAHSRCIAILSAPAGLVAPSAPRHLRPRSMNLRAARAALQRVLCRPCTAPRMARQFDIHIPAAHSIAILSQWAPRLVPRWRGTQTLACPTSCSSLAHRPRLQQNACMHQLWSLHRTSRI